MKIPHDEINESIKAKMQTLRDVKILASQLEARMNELEIYADAKTPLKNIDCNLITGETARKNIQTMIKSATIAAHEAQLALIDSSPDEAINHFNFNTLSDADKKTFRTEYKKALVALNKKDKAEITRLTDVTFE